MCNGLPEYDRVEGGGPLLVAQSFHQILVKPVLLGKESMFFTPNQIDHLAVAFAQEHLDQIKAKSAKYGLPWEDGRQEFSLIILDKGKEFDSTRGTLCQFIFGHWEKRMRRRLGAHTFAISLDSDDILGERTRALIENITVSTDDDSEEGTFLSDETTVAKLLSVARFISGKSISDLAQMLGVTPRRVRQMLQQLREKKTIPERFLFCVELACCS